jgi:hypothetical protein
VIRYRLTPDEGDHLGEPFEIEADSRDVIAWERRKAGRHLGMIQATPRMSDLAELAWLACQRQKRWTGDLADFTASVIVLPLGDDATEDEDDDGLLHPSPSGA